MTVLVGILCSDGALIASDSAATFGDGRVTTIGQLPVQKVFNLKDCAIYAATGAVGIAQTIAEALGNSLQRNEISNARSPELVMDRIGKQIAGIVTPYFESAKSLPAMTGAQPSSVLCKSMLAAEVRGAPRLFQFDFSGAPEQATPQLPFVSMGSGQGIADPFLALLKRLLWSDRQPSVAEARLAAVWTIDHVRRTNAGGVGGDIQMMTISGGKHVLAEVPAEEIAEHQQQIEYVERQITASVRRDDTAPDAPEPPK